MTKMLPKISGEDMEAFFAELSGASGEVSDVDGHAEDLVRFFSELPDIPTNESGALFPTPEHNNIAKFFFDVKPLLDQIRTC